METWDDQNFNSEWKKAFDGAEVMPSEKVWGNIDAQLLARENTNMKQRVIFYQRLAAASVGVLFLVSGYAFWSNNESGNSLAGKAEPKTGVVKSNENGISKLDSELEPGPKTLDSVLRSGVRSEDDRLPTTKTPLAQNIKGNSIDETGLVIAMTSNDAVDQSEVSGNTSLKENASITSTDYLHLVLGRQKLDPPMPKKAEPKDLAIAYRIADARPAVITKKPKGGIQNTWASLGFAAGNFTHAASNLDLAYADAGPQSTKSLTNTSNAGKTEKTKPGSTFTMSLAGGKRLSKRWVLQGGLSYLNQNSSSNTSTVGVAPANAYSGNTTGAAFVPENTNTVTYTTESEIKSTFQFISVPVQAGYLLLDRKFGVQVNGGISPDVFLRSAVSDGATGTESVTTTGSGSSFKAVSVSGIGGLEFSYGFLKHYRISLTPGVRYALTPVYKESLLASAKPLMADIGLKFRYVFN